MVNWNGFFGSGGHDQNRSYRDEVTRLLPSNSSDLPPSPFPAKEVTKIALRLKYQIEQVIPCELDKAQITRANSAVVTKQVIKTAKEAGGDKYQACVVYCLLVCKRWFKRQALLELWEADLHEVRAVACEVIAKKIIESEDDQVYLLQEMLLKRYSIVRGQEVTKPANVIERAVDQHAVTVIGSSGYQRCVKYLWCGWLHQDDLDPAQFVEYKYKTSTNYWDHLDPDRMRVPVYQNTVQIFFSLLYLALYTAAVNTMNATGDLDAVEAILYVMTAGFVFDEIAKFWKIGRFYFGFWNAFNTTLYTLLTISFFIRLVALTRSPDTHNSDRIYYNQLSYNFFAFSAPMFWMRLLLYLDSFRFFGSMLVIVKVMMKESLIFFALLIVVIVGFLQAFIGLDDVDHNQDITTFIIQAMANSVMQSPDFDGFDNFQHPFGLILYYIFTFVVMVILLNVLIALYNSAYEDVTENATDEFMALFAQKTMQFVRAPDENVFIAPFNLIEIFLLIIPFEWWLGRRRYDRLNNFIMGVIYSPLLVVTAWVEARDAKHVRLNRKRGEDDDDTTEEWEEMSTEVDFKGEGWVEKVEASRPNVEVDMAVVEVRELKARVEEVRRLVDGLVGKTDPDG